jgi:hypothetical protein
MLVGKNIVNNGKNVRKVGCIHKNRNRRLEELCHEVVAWRGEVFRILVGGRRRRDAWPTQQ